MRAADIGLGKREPGLPSDMYKLDSKKSIFLENGSEQIHFKTLNKKDAPHFTRPLVC